jgi:hypothetical protein
MRKLELKSPVSVGFDYWFLFDTMSELASHAKRAAYSSWDGGSWEECQQWAKLGRNEDVAASDDYIKSFEALYIISPRSRVVEDVAGAFPNVPAFLSDQPLNMRRRERIETETAPITIVLDTTVSGGISTETMQRRASALLALVRIASASRPIELWAGIGLGNGRRNATWVFARVETAPLDLARAAFMLGHAGYTRGLGYKAAFALHSKTNGHWPYKNSLSQDQFERVASAVFPGKILAINGTHIYDAFSSKPEAWIKATLQKIGVLTDETI